MRVFLCGMMGSGKTSLGKKLASKLHWTFIDLDHQIEKDLNKSINDIFNQNGEEYFRALETQTLLNAINNFDNVVISLGGGTPCFNNNIKLINDNGVSIFINTDINKISNRLLNAKKNRPLISKLNSYLKIKEFVSLKMEERLPFYTQCTYTINDNEVNADKIIELISQY